MGTAPAKLGWEGEQWEVPTASIVLGYCGNRAGMSLLGDSRLLRVVVLTSQDDSMRTSQVWDRLPRSATWQDYHFTCCRDLGLLTCVMKTKHLVRDLQGLQGENSALGMTLPPSAWAQPHKCQPFKRFKTKIGCCLRCSVKVGWGRHLVGHQMPGCCRLCHNSPLPSFRRNAFST